MEKAGILNKVVIPMISFADHRLRRRSDRDGPALPFAACRRPVWVNRFFGRLQLLSAAYMGFSHGMNDATKTHGHHHPCAGGCDEGGHPR